jgi:hypothetical protein
MMTRFVCFFVITLLVAALSTGVCFSEAIPVTGSAEVETHLGQDSLSVTGPGFSFFGTSGEGTNVPECALDTTCILNVWGDGDSLAAWSYPGNGIGSVPVTGDFGEAEYAFLTAPFTIVNPCVSSPDPDSCWESYLGGWSAGPIPAIFDGELTLTSPSGSTAIVYVAGIGTVNFDDGFLAGGSPSNPAINFYEATMTFTGEAVITPEPSSLVLMGSGIFATIGILRRKLLKKCNR